MSGSRIPKGPQDLVACAGKQPFADVGSANKAANRPRTRGSRASRRSTVYLCMCCQQFHLGRKGNVQARQRLPKF